MLQKGACMASLYQRPNGVYYLSVSFQGERISRSLETSSKSTAIKILPKIKRDIYSQLLNGKQSPIEILRTNGVEV